MKGFISRGTALSFDGSGGPVGVAQCARMLMCRRRPREKQVDIPRKPRVDSTRSS